MIHTNVAAYGRRFIRIGWPRWIAVCLYTPGPRGLRHSSLLLGLYVCGRLWTADIVRRP